MNFRAVMLGRKQYADARVVAKLEGKHWMYTGSRRIDVIKMCDDCRVAFAAEESFDPYGAANLKAIHR